MSRKFKIIKDYYDNGYDIYKKGSFTINDGITVFVGCNGSGKTTMLRCIKKYLEKNDIPVVKHSNVSDGGRDHLSKLEFFGKIDLLANFIVSSEGEQINQALTGFVSGLRNFIHSSKEAGEAWILFDAIDSGFSIDNIVEFKEDLLDVIIEDAKSIGLKLYIVISANSYEMARVGNPFDVKNGKYVEFSDYEDYKKFVLNSRKQKEEMCN